MGLYLTFECHECGANFSLRKGGDGWIDEEGRFGFALHPEWEPIGEPHGKIVPSYFDTYICLQCGQIFHFIGPNNSQPVYPERQIVDNQELWFIQGFESEECLDPVSNLPLEKTKARCCRCNGRIVGFFDMLHHLMERQKCRKFGLSPLTSEKDAYPCPKCKTNVLFYRGFSQT